MTDDRIMPDIPPQPPYAPVSPAAASPEYAPAPAAAPPAYAPAPAYAPPAAPADPLIPEPTTLPGGDSYRPTPAVMLAPGAGDRPVRPRGAPLMIALLIVSFALMGAAILVALQLRPMKMAPQAAEAPSAVVPSQTQSPVPSQPKEEERSFNKETAEPTIERALEAFRKHSPGIYSMVEERDTPVVKPTSMGLAFTWTYIDPASSNSAQVHSYTVELDDKGKPLDFYGD